MCMHHVEIRHRVEWGKEPSYGKSHAGNNTFGQYCICGINDLVDCLILRVLILLMYLVSKTVVDILAEVPMVGQKDHPRDKKKPPLDVYNITIS